MVARQLLSQAERSADGSDPGGVAAVVLADLAVETAAKTAAASRGKGRSKLQRDPSLSDVLQAVGESAAATQHSDPGVAVEVGEALQLRQYRNMVQHDAVIPGRDDVERSLRRALAFVRWCASEFFGLEWEEISRAILLRDDEIRGRVVLAERNGADGEYLVALAQLRVAFETAIRSQRAWNFDWTFIENDIQRSVARATGTEYQHRTDISTGGLTEVLKKIANRVEEIDEVVQAIAVGADPVEFAWFLRTAPVPSITFGTSPFWMIHDDETRERSDYVRGYEFVVSTLLRWQELPPVDDRMMRASVPVSETILENPETQTPQ